MLCKLLAILLAVVFLLVAADHALATDILRSEHGAPLKVIVRHDSAVFAEPDESSRSQPLRQFEFYFVLPADESKAKTKAGFYRIASGTSETNTVGWVKADAVVEWPHVQVLGFAKRAERDPAHFFTSQQDVESYLAAGTAINAISREPDGIEILSLLPILMESEIDVNGEKTRVFQVAYIHTADPKNIFVSYQPRESITIPQIRKEMTLDVVFVVDTTSSMTPYIEAAKEVIRNIAAAVNENQNVKGRVRLGLVGYRDKGDEYTSKVLCALETGTNLAAFEAVLGRTKAEGGGDNPEQVFAGMLSAVTEMNWNDIANRHIILIGDAPNHDNAGIAGIRGLSLFQGLVKVFKLKDDPSAVH